MKRKHILLFITSSVLLYISDLTAGALIALAMVYQMNLLFYKIPITRQSQIASFKLFLLSIPLFFFLGAIHSFLQVYMAESQWLFLICAFCISYFLFFLANFFCLYVFGFLSANQFDIWVSIQAALADIKNRKKSLLKQAFFLLIFSSIPFLTSDWNIIFSFMALQLYSHRQLMKQVFDSSH